MRTMTKVLVPLALAGATLVPVTASSAEASEVTAAAPAFTVRGVVGINARRNLIKGSGTIRDLTPGNDAVAVQTFIQRRVNGRWVDVVRGRRVAGNNVATSGIGWRRCANGKVYRVRVAFNYKNLRRGNVFTRAVVC